MRHSKSHSRPHTAGFTLAELLAVLALIGILLATGLPAWLNMTQTSKLDAAAGSVHSAARMARQYALTHNQPTYLVFHDLQSATGAVQTLAYRSYAIFTINVHTNQVTQDSGLFLSDWQSLPQGIVFEALTAEKDNTFQVGNAADWRGGFNRNHLLRIGDSRYIALGFTPQGTSPDQSSIYLAEGFYNESGELVSTSKQGRRICFSANGKSHSLSILYDEDGNPIEQ